MSQYAELDALILAAIESRRSPLYDHACQQEAGRIAAETGREDFRVTDLRLQALRRAGKIVHLTKAQANGAAGWHLAR